MSESTKYGIIGIIAVVAVISLVIIVAGYENILEDPLKQTTDSEDVRGVTYWARSGPFALQGYEHKLGENIFWVAEGPEIWPP